MKTPFACLSWLLLCPALTPAPANAQTFTNPLFTSQDPWVTYVNGNYYYSESYCSSGTICVKESSTLTGLSAAPWMAVWNPVSSSDPNGSDIWAPELHSINGGWYIYYAADNSGINNNHRLFVLTCSSPTGPCQPANTGRPYGALNESTGHWAIDPNVFTGTDGNLYLTWSCTNDGTSKFPQRICLAGMDSPVHISTATSFLSTPDRSWETRDAAIQEGPVGYSRDGRNYITYSGSASWVANDYSVGLLTNTTNDLLTASNWSKSGPIFDRHSNSFGPGSVVFVPSPDGSESWNLYHGIDTATCSPAYNCRDIRMQQMFFDEVGSPILGYPVDPHIPLTDPAGEGSVGNGTTAVMAWGPAWGDAAEGSSSGQVTGHWTWTDRFSASSSTGGSWNQIFSPGNPNYENFIAHAQAQWVATGTTDPYPKYGLYCSYSDSHNHAELLLDVKYRVLASHAVVGGTDQGWQNATLPKSFDPTQYHVLECNKQGSTYTFSIDPGTRSSVSFKRTFNLLNGQIGLVVDDTQANFRDVQILNPY